MNLEKLTQALQARGFEVAIFDTAEQAADHVAGQLAGRTIGIGGSVTVEQLGLYERLRQNNTVYWHWRDKDPEVLARAASAQVYLTSANAIAETGEIVNIDGRGNRIAAANYDKEKVFILAGVNKIAPDLPAAIDRARNVAAPRNARRLHCDTPCAKLDPPRCHDCHSPGRICCGMSILMTRMQSVKACEVVLIRQELGA